jgi:hypothetical protein
MLGYVSHITMYGSMFLMGTGLALAGGMGVFLPPGYRSGVLLALLAGVGVGIAGLAVGWAFLSDRVAADDWWRVFFLSSSAGFTTVAAGLAVAWRRARPQAVA